MRFTNEYPYRRTAAESVMAPSGRTERRTGVSAPENEYADMPKERLLHAIDALSFVKGELELYLDAYPDCQKALADYRDTLAMLQTATAAYESRFSPLWASAAATGNRWSWGNMPWPWHNDTTEDR